jgi:hypothetical protein
MHPQPIEEALLLKFNFFEEKKKKNKNIKHFGNYHNYDIQIIGPTIIQN